MLEQRAMDHALLACVSLPCLPGPPPPHPKFILNAVKDRAGLWCGSEGGSRRNGVGAAEYPEYNR